jgi:hypothetical protein
MPVFLFLIFSFFQTASSPRTTSAQQPSSPPAESLLIVQVVNPRWLPLKDVVVTVKRSNGEQQMAKTDDTGYAKFEILHDDDYEIAAEKRGFKLTVLQTRLLAYRLDLGPRIDQYVQLSLADFGFSMGPDPIDPFDMDKPQTTLTAAPNHLLEKPAPTPAKFHWNWQNSKELSWRDSLQTAKIAPSQKKALAAAIAEQLRTYVDGFVIKSESELWKKALDTRVRLVDLDGDGIPEVIAQDLVGCRANGNCTFWIFRKTSQGYQVLLDDEAQTFTVQHSISNGFHDIVLGTHYDSLMGQLHLFVFQDGSYVPAACYGYKWGDEKGDDVVRFKVPRLTDCGGAPLPAAR